MNKAPPGPIDYAIAFCFALVLGRCISEAFRLSAGACWLSMVVVFVGMIAILGIKK